MDMWLCEARIRRREPVEQGCGQLTIQSNKKGAVIEQFCSVISGKKEKH